MYYLVKHFLQFGFFFYYKRVRLVGLENIPKKGAVLFIPNHPNALIDPLLVAYRNPRSTYFLTRSSVFKGGVLNKFFASVHMFPIYRPRDGKEKMHLNEAIFKKCEYILSKEKSLVVFAEGSHNINKKVRPLKTGFARIALRTFQAYPELEDIKIIPVGMNYNHPTKAWSKASVFFGPALSAKSIISGLESELDQINALCKKTQEAMLPWSIHIEKNYSENYQKLTNSNIDLTDPIAGNQAIKDQIFPSKKSHKSVLSSLIYGLAILLNLIPFLIWKRARKGIKDDEFISTFRFGICMTLVPINLIICILIFGWLYLGLWVLSFLLSQGSWYKTI
ncbi:1-acyl-sn-glycerol-3-phosphate acyltransferase [Flavobacteriaceae bacterium]|nr:1-acyl-sn-glycerol-3-phosphate acyltransferase [Flavobacteriaceae bacterium]